MSKNKSQTVPIFVKKAFKALQAAVKKTIEDHYRSGDPIAVWRNGKAVWVPAARLHHRRYRRAA